MMGAPWNPRGKRRRI